MNLTRSEFARAVTDEFTENYGRAILRDLVITGLGERTAEEALRAGVAPGTVWLALCDEMDIPFERRHGVGRPDPAGAAHPIVD